MTMTDNTQGSSPQGPTPQGPNPQGPQGPQQGQTPSGGQFPNQQGPNGLQGGQGPQHGGPQGPGQYPYGGPQGPQGFGPGGPGGPYGPGGPGGPYGPGGQPPKKKNNALTIGLIIAGVVVLALFVGIGMIAKNLGSNSSSTAAGSSTSTSEGSDGTDSSSSDSAGQSDYAVGDCLDESLYGGAVAIAPEVVDCDSPEAKTEVLSVRHSESDTKCIDVEGAQGAFNMRGEDYLSMCIGDPKIPKEESINLISEGECMVAESTEAKRVDCSTPDAMKVVAVIQNPPEPPAEGYVNSIPECEEAGHPEAEMVYSWAVPTDDTALSGPNLDPDRGACLVTP